MRLTEGLPHANLLSAKRAWLYCSVNALAKISVATRRTSGDPSLKRGERTCASSQHRCDEELGCFRPDNGGDPMVKLQVNGQAQAFDGDPSTPLLWYLRDELGLTGTKYGCGVALCGACTIHIDGQAARACATTISDA